MFTHGAVFPFFVRLSRTSTGGEGRLRGLQHQTSSFCVINSLKRLRPPVLGEEEGSPKQSRAASVSRRED